MAFAFVCVAAEGCDLTGLMAEAKTIQVPADGPLTVGRLPHPHIFESCLGAQHRFLTFVSRRHVEIVPVPGDPGCFEITCLSPNPIVVGQEQIWQGQRKVARAPTTLAFLAAPGRDSPLVAFLTMSLEALACSALSPASSAGFAPQLPKVPASPSAWLPTTGQQWLPPQTMGQHLPAVPVMHALQPPEPQQPLSRCRGAAEASAPRSPLGPILGNTMQVHQVPVA
mmetsp:Transcript_38477/g.114269  ORF Transcript_38477/g.114269 Transcript_38477/m.114269 type:complete len:225 (+) Transcript_38477:184-858(+)